MVVEKCSQCERQAIGRVTGGSEGNIPLCVDHLFTFTKIGYLQATMAASHLNFIEQQIYSSSGGLVPLKQYVIPQPSFLQDPPQFNTIKIDNSNIGMLNAGTISNLKDVEFTIDLMTNEGQKEVAQSITELTQAVINNGSITMEAKEEISQQLKTIVTQIRVKPEERQKGVIKAVLAGIRVNLGTVADLITILNVAEPVIRQFFGI